MSDNFLSPQPTNQNLGNQPLCPRTSARITRKPSTNFFLHTVLLHVCTRLGRQASMLNRSLRRSRLSQLKTTLQIPAPPRGCFLASTPLHRHPESDAPPNRDRHTTLEPWALLAPGATLSPPVFPLSPQSVFDVYSTLPTAPIFPHRTTLNL